MPQNDEEAQDRDERSPLLRHGTVDAGEGGDSREMLNFTEQDSGNPREWSKRKKMINVAIIALMSVVSPLASSAFTPGLEQIADDLGTDVNTVIGTTTGFVIMLGVGPLILAPVCSSILLHVLGMCTHSRTAQ